MRSLITCRPGHRLVIVVALCIVAAGTGCGAVGRVGSKLSSDGLDAPRRVVLRPRLATAHGTTEGGHAFVARWSDDRLFMLSAHDLLGRRGGLDRDDTGAELDAPGNSNTTATNFDGDE